MLYYQDIRGKNDPIKLMEGYDIIKNYNIDGDNISVVYTEESKTYIALYKKNTLKFRIRHDSSSYSSSEAISSNSQNQIIYVEVEGSSKKIYVIDDNSVNDLDFDFKIKFHHPFIFYEFEKNEIWFQNINEPKVIHRFVFVNTVTAMDNIDDVNTGSNYQNKSPLTLGLILTYTGGHKIGYMTIGINNYGTVNEIYGSVDRLVKPIKFTELPTANILSFCTLAGINEKGKEEICIMFHYLNQLKFYYMVSGKIKKHIDKNLNKRNIIQFASRLFVWEDRGRMIERLETPIQKDEKLFFYKAYDAKNVIKLCKKVEYLPHKECLLISDEDKYVKIISYDETNKKFKIEKEYFVSPSFGVNESVASMSSYSYSTEMIYSNNETFLLQERGAEKAEYAIQIMEPANFNPGTLQFPLVSNEFVIKLLQNEGDYYGYYGSNNQKNYELYICPPFNSHTISASKYSKNESYRNKNEFFSPDDPSKIIRIVNDYNSASVNIVSQSGNIEFEKILPLNANNGVQVIISQNGRYVSVYSVAYNYEEPYNNYMQIKTFEISINAGSETGSHRENSKVEELNEAGIAKDKEAKEGDLQNKTDEMLNIAVYKEFKIDEGKDKNFNVYYGSNAKQKILNNGDYVLVELRNERFYVNDQNYYDQLFPLIQKHIKDAKRVKVTKMEEEKQVEVTTNGFELDRVEIGLDYLIIWTEKAVYSVRFGQLGQNKKFFYNFTKLRLVPVTEYRDITMERIAPTSHPDRILVIYTFKTKTNIIIFDIKLNDEINSFASREDDVFKFYVIGPEKQVQESIDYKKGGAKPVKEKKPKDKIAENGREEVYKVNEDVVEHEEEDEEEAKEKYRISHTGYLMFDKYYVNCTTMIPTPFMKFADADLNPEDWISGPRVNSDESLVLVQGQLYSSFSYQDIIFREKRDDYKVNKTDVYKYFVNRKSVTFDFVMEDQKLSRVIEMLDSDPLYLLMILTPDNHNKTPLDEAITNNSPKIVELFLSALIKVGEFKLSNAITSQFLELFDMGVEAFRHFLSVCYFTTEQMEMMKKMSANRKEGVYRWPTSSSILGENFNKTFLEDKKIIKEESKGEEDEIKELEDDSENEEDKDEETLLSDISIPQIDDDSATTEAGASKVEKRVEVKAIEFDWMLTTKEGEDFLERLRKTDNLGYFEIEVIKDLIMFQWEYFLPRIIIFLFVPFMLFFLMFILYTTWILDEMFNEADNSGPWHIAALTIGICILVFQLFFIYVELHQMFFHKIEYFKSFWNVLDITSILLNTAVVIMHLTDVKEDDLNA